MNPLEDSETARLSALHIRDTAPEQEFDDVAALAALVCAAPIALVSLLADDRLWVKARVGLDVTGATRAVAVCDQAIRQARTLVVTDLAADPRFAALPCVAGSPRLRFYAGVPLVAPNGHVVGAVGVFDHAPQFLTPEQIRGLEALGRQAMALMLRRRSDGQDAGEALWDAPQDLPVLDLASLDRTCSGKAGLERRIMGEFLRLLPSSLERLQDAVRSGDPEQVRFEAASLLGGSRTLGATAFADACATLKAAAKRGDLAHAPYQLARIDSEAARLRTVIETALGDDQWREAA